MRKILFSLLLATTMATPALAERPGHRDSSPSSSSSSDRDSSRSDHSQARSDHSAERSQRAEARQERAQPRGDMRVQNVERTNAGRAQVAARQHRGFGSGATANVNERGRPTLGNRTRSNDSVSAWRDRQRQQVATEQVQNQRRDTQRQRYDGRNDNQQQGGRQWDRNRDGARDGRNGQTQHWNSNWRNDHRYDWRNYRNHHRSTFHIGVYYDPFNYGYQRYNIGYRMQPNYYASNYWLNDPAMYALPYAPFPYKWVRYYNDALLVDTYTGQVADVIYDFFW
jgi:hypothetical protein